MCSRALILISLTCLGFFVDASSHWAKRQGGDGTLDCGTATSTSTIGDAMYATRLASCSVYSGSLAIATNAAGNVALSGVEQIVGNLIWAADDGQATLTLSNLTSAGTIQLSGLSGLTVNELQKVTGDLILNDNSLSSLTFRQLQNVSGTLNLHDNPQLDTVSLPALQFVSQAIYIDGSITSMGMNSLKEVGGQFNITSPVDRNFELPALTRVDGNFYLNSSNTNFDCEAFNQKVNENAFAGTHTCVQYKANSSGTSATSSATSSASTTGSSTTSAPTNIAPPNKLSAGDIAGIVIGVVLGLAALALGAWLLWRRKKQQHADQNKDTSTETSRADQAAEKDGIARYTLNELPTGREHHEVEAEHGMHEAAAQPVHELPGNR